MSYRSFKRVLGETNLERKCRFLFGACLLLLITGSFWWYGTVTERVVHEKNRSTGRHLVDKGLIKRHFLWYEPIPSKKPLVEELVKALENMDYDFEILALDNFIEDKVIKPSAREEGYLIGLKEEYEKKLVEISSSALSASNGQPESTQADAASSSTEAFSVTTDPLKYPDWPFREFEIEGENEYHFYQPVMWQQSCMGVACHGPIDDSGAMSANELALSEDLPFRVVKVVMPYEATHLALNENRAIFLAFAIITVFLAMVALYIVVRYVIVKPLQHLREVSDAISSGDYTKRAEIHTNDEFEDLAQSFNRTMRHLVEAHQELRNVNSNLDAKVDQLAQVNMQLYEANRLKSDFLANMSHELRTPLNSIIGFSDVLQAIDSLDEKQKRYAQNIGQSGRVLLEMINDILDLAKMESGKMEVSPTEFSIVSVVEAQCNVVRSLTEEKNIDLEVRFLPGSSAVYQDQPKVQQIVTNLLSNAIKFTPEGGRVVVDIERVGDQLKLEVSDTGVGIAEEDREIIFEKFRQGAALKQGDDLTREYTGTGLGLSIVKELCKLLGGEVSLESEVGKGSTFRVTIPWSLDATSAHGTSVAMAPPRSTVAHETTGEATRDGDRESETVTPVWTAWTSGD